MSKNYTYTMDEKTIAGEWTSSAPIDSLTYNNYPTTCDNEWGPEDSDSCHPVLRCNPRAEGVAPFPQRILDNASVQRTTANWRPIARALSYSQ